MRAVSTNAAISSICFTHQAGVGIMAPIAALEANPLPNAVAVVSLEDASKTEGQVTLPAGAVRLAVSIKVNGCFLC